MAIQFQYARFGDVLDSRYLALKLQYHAALSLFHLTMLYNNTSLILEKEIQVSAFDK